MVTVHLKAFQWRQGCVPFPFPLTKLHSRPWIPTPVGTRRQKLEFLDSKDYFYKTEGLWAETPTTDGCQGGEQLEAL